MTTLGFRVHDCICRETVSPSGAMRSRCALPRGKDAIGCHRIGEHVGFNGSLSGPSPSFVSHPIAHSARPSPCERRKGNFFRQVGTPHSAPSRFWTWRPRDPRQSVDPCETRSSRNGIRGAWWQNVAQLTRCARGPTFVGGLWHNDVGNGMAVHGQRCRITKDIRARRHKAATVSMLDRGMVVGTGGPKSRGNSWLWFPKTVDWLVVLTGAPPSSLRDTTLARQATGPRYFGQ